MVCLILEVLWYIIFFPKYISTVNAESVSSLLEVPYQTDGYDHIHHIYRKISNIGCTQNQNLNDSRLIMQLPLPNPLKPGVKSRMKM